MKNRTLGVIVLIFLVSTMAGCGGKFVKTRSEDLSPFADQTISMVADIAGGIEKARTITLQQMIDSEDPDVKQYLRLRAEINDLFALSDDDLACQAKDGGVGGVLASLMGHLKGASVVLNHSL